MSDEGKASSGSSLGDRLANMIGESTGIKSGSADPSLAASVGPSPEAWRLIRDGKEEGPFTLAELTAKVEAGELGPDDLVNRSGAGVWTKACDVAFLQKQFRQKLARHDTIDNLGKFHGIWLSKRYLLIALAVVVLLMGAIGGIAFWLVRRADAAEQRRIEAIWSLEEDLRRQHEEREQRIRQERSDEELRRIFGM